MTITLDALRRSGDPVDAILYSIEGSIYRLSVVVDGHEQRVLDTDGKTFQRRSVTHVREALRDVAVARMTLRQHSAYDEMIGQGERLQANTLTVPLAVARHGWPPQVA